MTLLEKQQEFSYLVSTLIQQAHTLGFEVTLGEAWRSPETAKIYSLEGKGIQNSLHCQRLAVDINLFRGDQYLSQTLDYAPLGTWWEKQSTPNLRCAWGGHFAHADGNHFSVSNDGVS